MTDYVCMYGLRLSKFIKSTVLTIIGGDSSADNNLMNRVIWAYGIPCKVWILRGYLSDIKLKIPQIVYNQVFVADVKCKG